MDRSRYIGLAAAVVVAGGALSACGSSDDSGGSTTAAGSTAAAAPAKGTVAFAQRDNRSDWWKAQNEGIQAAAGASGTKLLLGDGGGDAVKQNSQVQNYITQGVDAVVLNPADPVGVGPSVQALKAAKIPLVVVNSNLDDSLTGDAFCYVAEDQEATGAKVGERMAQVLADKVGPGKTLKAVIVGGYPSEVVTQLRSDGFKKGYASVKGAPKLNLLPTIYGKWVADQALAPMREVATANPDLDVLFVASDSMLPAVQSALEGLNRWNDVTIGTYDGAMSTVKYMIDNPKGPIVADGANVPDKQGEEALKIAEDAIAGKSQDEVCPGGTKYVDTPLYTPENAKESYQAGKSF
jgi:ribose transport system substrate-binding protein